VLSNTAQSYKLGPQALYPVTKMFESEQSLPEAVNKLSKMDSYDKKFMSLDSDVPKVQLQVDLSMRSIQVLQKEQIMLVKAVHGTGHGGFTGSGDDNGIMGSSPVPSGPNSSLALPSLSPQHSLREVTSITLFMFLLRYMVRLMES
jgi:hypothetical protein